MLLLQVLGELSLRRHAKRAQRALAGVRLTIEDVPIEVALLGERLAARVAREGALVGLEVHERVLLEVELADEGAVAHLANVALR